MSKKLVCGLFLGLGVIYPSSATNCSNARYNSAGVIVTPSTCVIFVSKNKYRGDLGGFSAADAKCQTEAETYHKSLTDKGIKFKALLAFNHATSMGKKYYRTDGTTLIAQASGPNLARTLNNSIINSASSGTFPIWTGIRNGMSKTGDQYTCDQWANYKYKNAGNTHDYHTYYGYGDLSGRGWDAGPLSACRDYKYLACVAQ